MLHFLPIPSEDSASEPYAEAVARLAGMRHALRLVDPFGGGPASDFEDEDISAAWDSASGSKQRTFDARSASVIGAAASGLEALLEEREAGRSPNDAASARVAEEIRNGLEDLSRLLLGPEWARN